MTVVDVNTGKFTGSGGNLEETVTKNNLEAAEEIVRQLRLRDIGGIIVVDFIDMVLESNRDLVLRRLVECLGRDRTRHQVAEVTSLGLVQMTRKRIGTGLVEAFSENCEHCQGRGVVIHHEPVEARKKPDEEPRRGARRGRGRGDGDDQQRQRQRQRRSQGLPVAAGHRGDGQARAQAGRRDRDGAGAHRAAGTGGGRGAGQAGSGGRRAGSAGSGGRPATGDRGTGDRAGRPPRSRHPRRPSRQPSRPRQSRRRPRSRRVRGSSPRRVAGWPVVRRAARLRRRRAPSRR